MYGGRGSARFFLQPAVAIVLGVLHGLRDRRLERPAYFVDLMAARGRRMRRAGEGLRDVAAPICVALLASFGFQYIVRSRISISYGLAYATLFVAIPYFLTRGLANRLAHRPHVTKRT
jgi:hypothetical protein